jgi:hypothetical protein
MSLIAPFRQWSMKPPLGAQIAWGDPLARGLVGAWLMNEGGGVPVDLVTNTRSTVTAATWAAGMTGPGMIVNGATDIINTNAQSHIGANGAGSYALRFMPGFSPTDSASHFMAGAANVGETIELVFRKYSDNNIYAGWFNGTESRVALAATAANMTQNVWQDYVLTWSQSGSILYRNGVSIGSTVTAAKNADISIAWSWLAELNQIGGSSIAGSKIEWGYLWSRALTPAEVQRLYVNPYALVAPAPRPLWVPNVMTPANNLLLMGCGT